LEANRERRDPASRTRCVAVAVGVAGVVGVGVVVAVGVGVVVVVVVAVAVVVVVVVAVAVAVGVVVGVGVGVGVAVGVVKKSADPRERTGAFALIRPLRRRRFGWRYGYITCTESMSSGCAAAARKHARVNSLRAALHPCMWH
jgi:hypothetical protein